MKLPDLNGFPYVVGLTIFSISLYYYSTQQRTTNGYFTDPFWITVNSFAYILFFAVMTGFVIGKVVKNKKQKGK